MRDVVPAATGSDDLTAQDLLLQALPAIYRLERDSFLRARRLLEMSLRADPGSSVAHGWLAYWDLLYVGQGWSDDPAASTAEAARLAERAVMLDPGDARALTLAGHVRGFLGKHPEEATALHERAIALNPNLALAWCFSGLAHSYLGRHEEALRRINGGAAAFAIRSAWFFLRYGTDHAASDAAAITPPRSRRGGARSR